ARQAAGAADAPLSRREAEVARLVTRGASNRTIAEELYLSGRTVEQHVSSALRKLGLPNRAALAAWMIRRDAESRKAFASRPGP
ncbi:response regulator transcription factor, partial [Microbacterium sp.]|uniref:response regulator transcription factor n=1 Tax=Microbacterium sp. TaxID=51671 RepID=UPI003C755935